MGLGNPVRRRSAVGLISMALALAAAAFVGSSMGFIWGLFTSEEEDAAQKANVAEPGG